MAHLRNDNDLKAKQKYIKEQKKIKDKQVQNDDDYQVIDDELDKAFNDNYQICNDEEHELEDLDEPQKDKITENKEKLSTTEDLDKVDLFDSSQKQNKGDMSDLNSDEYNLPHHHSKSLREENKGQNNEVIQNINTKIKQERKNKKGTLKMVIVVAMLLSLIFPLILYVTVVSAVVGGGGAVIGALVDPQQRAELQAKNEFGDKDVTHINKDILGAEFKDFNPDANNQANQQKSDKKDSDSNLSTEGLGDARQKLMQLAQSQVDKKVPYVWGGTTWDKGMDCSGFVQQLYKHIGINLPRTSEQQAPYCHKIDQKDAKAGDLIFFDEHGDVGHVAVYAGNDELYEEPQPGECCHKIKLYNMHGATRFFARVPAMDGK